jgi:hypothetical protein
MNVQPFIPLVQIYQQTRTALREAAARGDIGCYHDNNATVFDQQMPLPHVEVQSPEDLSKAWRHETEYTDVKLLSARLGDRPQDPSRIDVEMHVHEKSGYKPAGGRVTFDGTWTVSFHEKYARPWRKFFKKQHVLECHIEKNGVKQVNIAVNKPARHTVTFEWRGAEVGEVRTFDPDALKILSHRLGKHSGTSTVLPTTLYLE